MFVHLHSFYWIFLIGKNMAFNGRENIHVFKLCYLTTKVVIYALLSTFKTKKLKHPMKNHKCQMVHIFPCPT